MLPNGISSCMGWGRAGRTVLTSRPDIKGYATCLRCKSAPSRTSVFCYDWPGLSTIPKISFHGPIKLLLWSIDKYSLIATLLRGLWTPNSPVFALYDSRDHGHAMFDSRDSALGPSRFRYLLFIWFAHACMRTLCSSRSSCCSGLETGRRPANGSINIKNMSRNVLGDRIKIPRWKLKYFLTLSICEVAIMGYGWNGIGFPKALIVGVDLTSKGPISLF
jgi:hypothetical protein